MGGGGGQTTTQQSKQDTQPWSAQQPYLTYGFEQAQNLYNNQGPLYYGGNTVAGFTPAQQQAQNMGIQRATAGSPLQQAGQAQQQDTINGTYLNAGNPYVSDLTQSIDAAVRPRVTQQFGAAGRLGGVGQESAYTTAMANAIAPQLFSNYQNERGMQQNAAQNAPAMAASDYTDINALANIGQTQQEQNQNVTNADIQRWNYNQNLQQNKLAQYMGLVNGNYGGTSQGTTTSTAPGPGKGGQIGSILGGVGSVAAGAGVLF